MHRKPLKLFCIHLLIVFLSSFVHAKYDSTLFERKERASNEEKIQFNLENNENSAKTQIVSTDLSLEIINTRLSSISSILKLEGNTSQKIEAFIARATLYLQKMNVLRNEKEVGKNFSKKELRLVDRCKKDLNNVLDSPVATKKQTSYANYLLAVLFIDLGKTNEAFSYFSLSLKYNAEAKYLPGIVFFMSEYYQKQGKPRKSFELLSKYLSYMKDKNYSLALYKMAWSLVAAGQKFLAETYFKKLLNEGSDSNTGKAAIREIALISSEIRSQKELVKMSFDVFPEDQKKRLEFLSSAYSNFRRVNPDNKAELIFSKLNQIARTPESRINLWLDEMRASDRDFASSAHMSAFNSLRKEMSILDSSQKEKILPIFLPEVEVEVSRLISSYITTLSGQTKNEERKEKESIGKELLEQLEFYSQYFPDSSKKEAIYELRMDVAEDLEQNDQLLAVSKKIISNPSLISLHEKAELNKIKALDRLSTSGKREKRNTLISSLRAYISHPEKGRWQEFANYLANILQEEGRTKEAFKILEQIYDKYPTEETLSDLIMGAFRNEDFKKVLILSKKLIKYEPRIKEVIRQSHLQLAVARKGKDRSSYQFHIKNYLDMESEKEKRDIVVNDYFRGIRQSGKWKLLLKETLTYRNDWLLVKEHIEALATEFYKRGKWSVLQKLLTKLPNIEKSEKLLFNKVALDLSLFKKIDLKNFTDLNKDNQRYFFQSLSISKPDLALQLVRQLEGLKEPFLNEIITAIKIKCSAVAVCECNKLDEFEKKMIGIYNKNNITSSEKIIANIKMPSYRKPQELNQKLLTLIDHVRLARSKLGESLKNSSFEGKIRTLNILVSTENQVNKIVRNIKIPNGASLNEVEEFRSTLKSLSEEFFQQVAVYQQVKSQIFEDSLGQSSSRRSIASIGSSGWPKGGELSGRLNKIARKYDTHAALFYIDELKDKGLPQNRYLRYKGELLKGKLPNPGLKLTFYQELKNMNEQKLAAAWGEL